MRQERLQGQEQELQITREKEKRKKEKKLRNRRGAQRYHQNPLAGTISANNLEGHVWRSNAQQSP